MGLDFSFFYVCLPFSCYASRFTEAWWDYDFLLNRILSYRKSERRKHPTKRFQLLSPGQKHSHDSFHKKRPNRKCLTFLTQPPKIESSRPTEKPTVLWMERTIKSKRIPVRPTQSHTGQEITCQSKFFDPHTRGFDAGTRCSLAPGERAKLFDWCVPIRKSD